jgi:hypothetical protein
MFTSREINATQDLASYREPALYIVYVLDVDEKRPSLRNDNNMYIRSTHLKAK